MNHSGKVELYFNQPQLYLQNNIVKSVRAQIVKDMLGDIQLSAILDIGCGDGYISLQFLSETNFLTLIDLSVKMLDLAKAKISDKYTDRVSVIQSDFMNYVPETVFDIVLCIGVLAHVQDLETTIRKIVSLMKSQALCLLQFSDQEQWTTRINYQYYKLYNTYNYPIMRIKRAQLFSLCKNSGLSVIDQRSYWTMLPGFGKLPTVTTQNILRWLTTNRHLVKFGGEKIWLLKKQATHG